MPSTSPSLAGRLALPLFLLAALLAAPVSIVGALWWNARGHERRAEELARQLAEQRALFELEMGRVLGETRRAQFRVVSERREGDRTIRRLRFVEFFREDDASREALRRDIEIAGEEIYIDAVLVRHDDEAVRAGRARNFAVFRRLFSDVVAPADGEPLYDVSLRRARTAALGRVELPRVADADAFVARLVAYLNDPDLAARDGVRLIEGEAKYVNPRPGYYYDVVQQAHGGLLIEEHPIPEVLRDDEAADTAR